VDRKLLASAVTLNNFDDVVGNMFTSILGCALYQQRLFLMEAYASFVCAFRTGRASVDRQCMYMHRRLGGVRAATPRPLVTGKSFCFDRACARCPWPSAGELQASSSTFSLFPCGLVCSRITMPLEPGLLSQPLTGVLRCRHVCRIRTRFSKRVQGPCAGIFTFLMSA